MLALCQLLRENTQTTSNRLYRRCSSVHLELHCWQVGIYWIVSDLFESVYVRMRLPPCLTTRTAPPPLPVHTPSNEMDIANPRRFLSSDIAQRVASNVPYKCYTCGSQSVRQGQLCGVLRFLNVGASFSPREG